MWLYECPPVYHPLQDSHFGFFFREPPIFFPIWATISSIVKTSLDFNSPYITLNIWSMSSCVWPTRRKPISTSSKILKATNIEHKPNMYLFLFSLQQLSACIHKMHGKHPRASLTFCIAFMMEFATWLLSCSCKMSIHHHKRVGVHVLKLHTSEF